MKKPRPKKLVLRSDTVRVLRERELVQAAGGNGATTGDVQCPGVVVFAAKA
jgi:hypothetical protein